MVLATKTEVYEQQNRAKSSLCPTASSSFPTTTSTCPPPERGEFTREGNRWQGGMDGNGNCVVAEGGAASQFGQVANCPPSPSPLSPTPSCSSSSSSSSCPSSRSRSPSLVLSIPSPSPMPMSTMHGLRNYNSNNFRGNAARPAEGRHRNEILLVEAQRQRQIETFEEMKRLLMFAGIFFLFAIAFILMRLKISIDDVFKWSPVIWLLGVINCGLLMNLFIHVRKYVHARKIRRERERRDLLLSLNLPDSFPCLAPPGTHCCHQHHQEQQRAELISRREVPLFGPRGLLENGQPSRNLPTYDQIDRCPLLSPPAFVLHIQQPQQRQKQQEDDTPPPEYDKNCEAKDYEQNSVSQHRLADPTMMGEGDQTSTDEGPPVYSAITSAEHTYN